jgi:hypothetical protein
MFPVALHLRNIFAEKQVMAEGASKFMKRATRYSLTAGDDRFFRFVRQSDELRSHTTEFTNISMTGMAFLVDPAAAPDLGEIIKFEIPVPGDNSRIAWWGEVVRRGPYEPQTWWEKRHRPDHDTRVLVGIRFAELPMGHREAIERGIVKASLRLARERQGKKLSAFYGVAVEYRWTVVSIVVAGYITFSILAWLMKPAPNYDPLRGSPWGQRFPQFNWNSDK